ncbi:hypothetical protein [Polyangium sorediatum]|uniref:Transcriptional regulator n=1 Tax=Polyangium sorediatum TaxID=889274 RepID=A0ABT6P908_9BACT|nr:hypothetical protein [Polyangium sorediatum]MDI1437056.1 hypothetical protein [Polyangium sorediatum]
MIRKQGYTIVTRDDEHEPVTVDIDLTRIREELLVIGARLALRARAGIDLFGHDLRYEGTGKLARMSRDVLAICAELQDVDGYGFDCVKSRPEAVRDDQSRKTPEPPSGSDSHADEGHGSPRQ